VRTRLRPVELVALLGIAVLAGSLWSSRASAQLARPGEDPRPMNTQVVGPLPLPVAGDVRVTGDVRVSTLQPMPVQVINPPGATLPPFLDAGRCYFIDVHGAPIWRDALWRIDAVQGTWMRVRPARAGADPAAGGAAWINTARVTRMSEAQACE
jgi:hypothetical protein